MSGQTLYYDKKQNIVDEFVNRVNIYESHTPFNFDLRGYKKYLNDNKVKKEQITEDIAMKFMN